MHLMQFFTVHNKFSLMMMFSTGRLTGLYMQIIYYNLLRRRRARSGRSFCRRRDVRQTKSALRKNHDFLLPSGAAQGAHYPMGTRGGIQAATAGLPCQSNLN